MQLIEEKLIDDKDNLNSYEEENINSKEILINQVIDNRNELNDIYEELVSLNDNIKNLINVIANKNVTPINYGALSDNSSATTTAASFDGKIKEWPSEPLQISINYTENGLKTDIAKTVFTNTNITDVSSMTKAATKAFQATDIFYNKYKLASISN